MNKEAIEILNYCKRILSGEQKHSFSKYLGKYLSERSIETPWVASIIRKHKINSLLDIGFTMSSLDYMGLLLEINKNYGVQIEAVDIINPERVKTRYPKEWLKEIFSIPFINEDIRKIHLQEEKYDAITCISTIEHIGFDIPKFDDAKTAFDRKLRSEDVIMNRSPDTNKIILDKFYIALKKFGKLLISVPIGKGGPILLQDSLGYYTAEWEYEENSWNEIIQYPKFELISQFFFKFTKKGLWKQVNKIKDLSKQDSSLKVFAQGCGIALLSKI